MMRNYAAAIVMVIGLTGCYVNPVTDEKKGPDVFFREGDKTIDDVFLTANMATPAKFGPESSIACDATDPGGVKSISLSFEDTTKVCVTSGGCGASGICPGSGGMLSPLLGNFQSETSHPDSSGQVPSELFLLATLKDDAYECIKSGDGKTIRGEPFGQTVKATCEATNYSGKKSTATLRVTFSPPKGVTWCCTGGSCNCEGKSSTTQINVCCADHVCQSNGACEKPH
jgi:hypothetical protein